MSSKRFFVLLICSAGMLSCVKERDPLQGGSSRTDPVSNVVNPEISDPADRIYLAGGYTNEVYALNAESGKLIWTAKVSGTVCTSAAYTEGTVVVRGTDDNHTAFDESGKQKWTFHGSSTLNLPHGYPVVAARGIIYTRDDGHIYALYSSNGKVKWTYSYPERTPLALVLKNDVLYCNGQDFLTALDAEKGLLRWQIPWFNQPCTPIIFDQRIYFLSKEYWDGWKLLVFNTNSGTPIWYSQKAFPKTINVKYGRIYDVEGMVTDSATATISYPRLESKGDAFTPGSPYPLLVDSLAILGRSICDAFTGRLICELPIQGGSFYQSAPSAATYVNHILYYITDTRNVYDGYLGGHDYSDVYAFDVRKKSLLWHTAIENAVLFYTEPCVVTKGGRVYRGTYSF